MHALNGVLGEWLFGFRADGFTELGVEGPKVFRPQLCELVVAQGGENADDVLLVPADGGLGQLAGGNLPQPKIDVGGQSDGLCGSFRRIARRAPPVPEAISLSVLASAPGADERFSVGV